MNNAPSSSQEMDRQLIASSAKAAGSSFESGSVQHSSSSSSSFSSHLNTARSGISSNNNTNLFRNQNQNRRNHNAHSGQRSSNYNSIERANNGRNNLNQRFNGHRKVPQTVHSLTKVNVKERFVQANCQFVMKSSLLQDYSSHLKDPDLPIDWNNVEEVIFKNCSDDQVCCPICLSDPVAAKITRCGHIYCWSCILHYLALSDDNYRPCPICYEKVRKSELKSATVLQKVFFKKKDFMTFRLMKISKGFTVAFPANYNIPDNVSVERLNRNVDDTLNQVCKYFVSTPLYLEQLIVREETELFRQKLEYQQENMPEICFVEEALSALDTRKEDLLSLEQLSDELAMLLNNEQRLSQRNASTNDWIYFYLSDDGQPIFLNGLNVRMLKHEYGEMKNCPETITARIVDIFGGSANEDFRRRNQNYRHLPLTCELKVVEIELTADHVSQATLEHFAPEILRRNQDRRRKDKKQQKRDRRIDIENHRKIFGIPIRGPTFDFNDANEFPTWADFGSSPESGPSGQSYPELVPSPDHYSPPTGPTQDPLPPLSGSSSPPKEFQSSFASLLHGNNQFQASAPSRKTAPAGQSTSRILEGANQTVTSMDISMSDFLENCIKRSKPKKNKKGRKSSD